jgi:pSer/pThr/pTyr-binding forkhead associated (FHA) protein
MSDKLVLRIKLGPLGSRQYAVLGEVQCVIGRGKDCMVYLPAPEVSRHHCLLEVTPPSARVRDLGSRNGTFVNGVMIGRRESRQHEGASRDAQPCVELHPGDELRVGPTIFEIDVPPDGSHATWTEPLDPAAALPDIPCSLCA